MMAERYIPKIDRSKPIGPQLFERYESGDTVAHIRLGDGLVTRKTEEYVVVQFAGAFAEFDVGWFGNYPDYLFHRST